MKTVLSVLAATMMLASFAQADGLESFRPGRPGNPGWGRNLCSGTIRGTWGYKGGRPMSLTVQQQGHGNVVVFVNHQNGSDAAHGQCWYNRDGSANLRFTANVSGGQVVISPNGRVRGSVYAHSFVGRLN